MYEFHPYFTNDGSVGLYNPEVDDIYHSAAGAYTEACEKFIYPVNFDELLKNERIKVLDICYGIGYNSKAFLNFLFENYFQGKNKIKILKKFCNKYFSIETIYTNNILALIFANLLKKSYQQDIYNEKIYTNNTIPEIYIKAVDIDKTLSYISPFIKTGKKNFVNKNEDFNLKKFDKYFQNKDLKNTHKIPVLINFLIFEKILESDPKILTDLQLEQIINNKEYRYYLDSFLTGIFKFYKFNRLKSTNLSVNLSLLHNIYYRYITNCYKNRLKAYNLQDIVFELKNEDARKTIIEDKNLYNLIFLDAFTPSKCPCLWSYEFFKELYNHLSDNGMLLTYSSAAAVRSAMIKAGFYVGSLYNEREKKFTGTIAVKNKSLIKYPLSEFDLGLLKTRAGIFYRDENLTALNADITAARSSEVKSSSRISSSYYISHYKN